MEKSMKAHEVSKVDEVPIKVNRKSNLASVRERIKIRERLMTNTLKVVGANGQISLGKAFAGKSVEISTLDENTIVIKTGQFIPDNQKWLYEENNMARLDKAIDSAAKREVNYGNFEELMAIFERRIAQND